MDATQGIIDALRDHLGDGRVVVIVLPPPAPEVKPPEPELLTIKEAVAMFKIGQRTIYRLVEQGLIPSHRAGRAIRLRPADLRRYLAESGTRLR